MQPALQDKLSRSPTSGRCLRRKRHLEKAVPRLLIRFRREKKQRWRGAAAPVECARRHGPLGGNKTARRQRRRYPPPWLVMGPTGGSQTNRCRAASSASMNMFFFFLLFEISCFIYLFFVFFSFILRGLATATTEAGRSAQTLITARLPSSNFSLRRTHARTHFAGAKGEWRTSTRGNV